MRFFFVIEAVGLIFLSTACAEKVKPAKVNVTVMDSKNDLVSGASVEFYVNSSNIKSNSIDTTVYSDKNGKVALEMYRDCFLDILVLKTDGSVTKAGTSSVDMELGKTATQQIIIQ